MQTLRFCLWIGIYPCENMHLMHLVKLYINVDITYIKIAYLATALLDDKTSWPVDNKYKNEVKVIIDTGWTIPSVRQTARYITSECRLMHLNT